MIASIGSFIGGILFATTVIAIILFYLFIEIVKGFINRK